MQDYITRPQPIVIMIAIEKRKLGCITCVLTNYRFEVNNIGGTKITQGRDLSFPVETCVGVT